MLAGFSDDRADEGPSAGPASLVGLELARDERLEGARVRTARAAARRRASAVAAAEQADTSRAESETKVDARPAADTEDTQDKPDSKEAQVMVDTLTPVLSDNWDADRSWTLAAYEDARRLPGAQDGARPGARTTSSSRSRTPACAVAAARASRPA